MVWSEVLSLSLSLSLCLSAHRHLQRVQEKLKGSKWPSSKSGLSILGIHGPFLPFLPTQVQVATHSIHPSPGRRNLKLEVMVERIIEILSATSIWWPEKWLQRLSKSSWKVGFVPIFTVYSCSHDHRPWQSQHISAAARVVGRAGSIAHLQD